MSRIDPNFHENLFRPTYELNSGVTASIAGVTSGVSGGLLTGAVSYISLGLSAYLLGMATKRFSQGLKPLRQQIKMFSNKKLFCDHEWLRKAHDKDKDHVFIGEGFEWGTEHADRAYQIQNMSSDKSEINLPLVIKPLKKKWDIETRALGGKPWIHGLGDSKNIFAHNSMFYGHTFIAGNVGTGKTQLLKLLSIGVAIHRDHLLIIVDPKGDASWRDGIKEEMEKLGKGQLFYHFNPNKESESIKIDPIKNWNRSTEIADRLTNLTAAGSTGGDAFSDFGWKIINQVVDAMLFCGDVIQIKTIYRNLVEYKYKLAERTLTKHFNDVLGKDFLIDKKKELAAYGKSTLAQLVGYYETNLSEKNYCKEVESAIQLIQHDAVHMSKMTSSLLPLFEVLTAKPLADLISPDDNIEDDDDRLIVNSKDIMKTGGVLYLSLGSLADTKTAGHLAKMYLSDFAALAGNRYEYGEGEREPRRVSIFVDEVHAALAGNVSLINLLAQARGASFQLFLATQTIPDLESQTDAATAKRVLGLCNNFFSLRCQDSDTQEFVSQQFGKTQVSTLGTAVMQMGDTTTNLSDFKASRTETLTKTEADTFPAYLLGDLPILQYMARLADGRKIKGKIPILINKAS
jgi:conjugal transfer pilus assembly protein TraD